MDDRRSNRNKVLPNRAKDTGEVIRAAERWRAEYFSAAAQKANDLNRQNSVNQDNEPRKSGKRRPIVVQALDVFDDAGFRDISPGLPRLGSSSYAWERQLIALKILRLELEREIVEDALTMLKRLQKSQVS